MDLAARRHPQGRVGPWVHARAVNLGDALVGMVTDARRSGFKSFETLAAAGAALAVLLLLSAVAGISAALGSTIAAVDVPGTVNLAEDLPTPLVELGTGIWESGAAWFDQHATGYSISSVVTGLVWLILGAVLLLFASHRMSTASRITLGAWIIWSLATTTIVILGSTQAPVLAGAALALALGVLTLLRCAVAAVFHDLLARADRRWQLRAQEPAAQRQADLAEVRELTTIHEAAQAVGGVDTGRFQELRARLIDTVDQLMPRSPHERAAEPTLQRVQEGRSLAGYRTLALAGAYVAVWVFAGVTGAVAVVWFGILAAAVLLASAAYSYDVEYRDYRRLVEQAETLLGGDDTWQPHDAAMANRWLRDLREAAERTQSMIAEQPSRYNELSGRLTSLNEEAERIEAWIERHPQRPALGERATSAAIAIALAGLATLAFAAGGWWIAAGIVAGLGTVSMIAATIDPSLGTSPTSRSVAESSRDSRPAPALDDAPF